jgi:hypothetical protein
VTTFIYCTRHRTALEWHSEPMRPTPPPDQVCTECLAEKRAQPTLERRTGTESTTRIVNASTPDDDYLAHVRNPQAREKLIELRDRQRERRDQEAAGAATLDTERPTLIEFDRSRPGPDRRSAHRRMMRASRGARW